MTHGPTRHEELRVLDLLAIGIALLDGDGRVIFANAIARDLTAEHDGISIADQVRIEARADAKTFRNIVRTLAGPPGTPSPTAKLPATGLALPRPSGERDLLLLASRIPETTDGPSRLALFVSDPERNGLELPEGLVANLFDLTETETRIALALAEGRRKDQIAEHFQVSKTTVAFHLRNLFQKTHTSRQAELIALMLCGLGLINPEPFGV
jgi:DNA-binding CsgD family transcriptional regulator